MMAKGHALSGAALWIGCSAIPGLLGNVPSVTALGVGAAVAAASAIAPDIDHPQSKIARVLGPVSWLIAKGIARVSAYVHEATRTREDRTDRDGHRTLTHTLLAGMVVSGLVTLVLLLVAPGWAWVGLPVLVGWTAHLLGDSCTNSGCPMFWPLRIAGRRWYLAGLPMVLRFKTGGTVETWLITPALGLLVPALVAWRLGVWTHVTDVAAVLAR